MEEDDEGEGGPNEEEITWREFTLVLLISLLDMESGLDELSGYRKRKDKQ